MIPRIKSFIKVESVSGVLLFAGAFLALCISNTELNDKYLSLIHLPISITVGDFSINKSLLKWVNDGLMALFFLMLTLEAKFHCMEGEFSDKSHLPLALITALGGVIVPALIYLVFTDFHPFYRKGWAIPIATDTAFVLGVLSFLTHKIPFSARIFVLNLSIIDDVIAVLVLAIFYSPTFHFIPLLFAIILVMLLGVLNFFNIRKLSAYFFLGLCLWLALVESGIHGTLAGVVMGLFIPLHIGEEEHYSQSPLKRLEHLLHPFVAFMVLPLFAFLNTEISFNEISLKDLGSPISLGIIFGLLLGKQLGIILGAFGYIKLKKGVLPHGLSWLKFYGISVLCGIGFTFSLFIGLISFEDASLINQTKFGVITGSLLSALWGTIILLISPSLSHPTSEK